MILMPRRRFKKELRKTILFYCEGETEARYFEGLRQYLGKKYKQKINIVVKTTDHNTSILNAKKYVEVDIKYHQKQYDLVFLIVDKDNNDWFKIKSVMNAKNKYDINFILSNPKFEYWILLHYKYFDGYLTSKQLDELLEKKYYVMGLKYKGDSRLFEKTMPKIGVARRNAKKRYNLFIKTKEDLYSDDSNPITLVFNVFDNLKTC